MRAPKDGLHNGAQSENVDDLLLLNVLPASVLPERRSIDNAILTARISRLLPGLALTFDCIVRRADNRPLELPVESRLLFIKI